MIGNQFIILNTGIKEKKLKIYPVLPIWKVPLKMKYYLEEASLYKIIPTNKWKVQSEYYHFAIFTEVKKV